ncbi:MAG: hypothetical protein ACYCWW_06590 [Deltaproteobacteria bacterium]
MRWLVLGLWAWTGFVSCDDPERVAAAVRAALPGEQGLDVSCNEPRIWESEKDWACDVYVRGTRRCFHVQSLDQPAWEVTCRRHDPDQGKIVLPPSQ